MLFKVMTASGIFLGVAGIFILFAVKRVLLKVPLALFLFLLSTLFLVSGLAFEGYKNLLEEETVGVARAERVDNRIFLTIAFSGEPWKTIYILEGEKWGVGANFLKWKKWLSFLGIKPVYRITKIEGVSDDGKRISYEFPHERKISSWMWKFLLRKGHLLPFIDMVFESDVYSSLFGRDVEIKVAPSGFTLSLK